MRASSNDIVIIGGGLAGGLIALALAGRKPSPTITLVERGERLGGDHVWSFFASDVPPAGAALVEPLIVARWDDYEVRFPGRERRLATPYRSVTGERLDAALRDALPAERLLTGRTVAALRPREVELDDGTRILAGAVIDARGASALPHMAGGWQKFLGQMLRLHEPHGLRAPIVMDATVEQVDGYRFVYALPFSEHEVFVEDTYYSDDPSLDRAALRDRIAAYAGDRGWRIAAVDYEETGVLPVIGSGDFAAFGRAMGDPGVARVGTRAALVHPLTSYSLPFAVALALHLSALDNLSGEAVERLCDDFAREHWRHGRFYRMLTRMLFGAAAPGLRYKVLERFYGLPAPLIERFYAGRSTRADMLRILAGKPPVPLGAALGSLIGLRPLAPLS